MNPLIELNLTAIAAHCREFGVARLEVFGSAVTEAFDPDRFDVDCPTTSVWWIESWKLWRS